MSYSEKKYWTELVFMFVIGMLIGAALFFAGALSGGNSPNPTPAQIILGIVGLISFFGCMIGMIKSVRRCVGLDVDNLERQTFIPPKAHALPLYQLASDTSPVLSHVQIPILQNEVYSEYPLAIYGGSDAWRYKTPPGPETGPAGLVLPYDNQPH